MNSALGKHERSDYGISKDMDFASDHEDFSLPRNYQPTGYVDTENMEQTNMDTHLPETNIGYRLMLKMGWAVGEGLGSDRQGRVDPIRIDMKRDSLGIGKAEEEMEYHISSTAQRRALDSERQLEETEQEKLQREITTLKKEEVKNDIKETLRAFYCELCDKQYTKISEYEQHLQSYDHHHKKRFKDMRESSKSSQGTAERESRRERERKREERENRRIQQAMLKKSGIKLDKIPSKPCISNFGTSDLAAKGTTTIRTEDGLARKSGDGHETAISSGGGWSTVPVSTGSLAASNKPSKGEWSSVPVSTEYSTVSDKPSTGGWSNVPVATNSPTVSDKPSVGGLSTATVTTAEESLTDVQTRRSNSLATSSNGTTIIEKKESDSLTLFSGKKQPQKMSFGISKKPGFKFSFNK